MNMRKIIAILAAVLLLCAAIPMAAISVSAAAKLDNNFDDGTVGKFKADETIVNEDGALKWTTTGWKNLYASFSVTANGDYKVSFKIKAAASTAMEVKFLNGSWGDSGIVKETINVGTEWQDYTRIFNAGSNNGLVLLFQSHKATDVYLDNVKVADYVVPVDPVFPSDAIYVETFESGSLNGWNYNCSVVSTEGLAATNAEGGNYCLEFISPSYSYTNYKLNNLEKNTDYKVTFSVLSATSGYPLNARVRDGSGDLGYAQYTPSTTAWETHTYLFNSGNNTSANLRFQAGWETGTYYIDNISVAPVDLSAIANDGHVMNGNFESGDNLGWNASANTAIVTDPTGAGQGYVIKTSETGSSVDMFTQEFKNLVAGKTYTISLKVYGYGTATNNVFFIRVPKDVTFSNPTGIATSDSGKTYVARFNMNANTGKWITVTLDFVATSSTALIQIQNYRSGQGFYYFDDIALSHAYDAVVTNPDCVNGGYTTYTCACGASYTDNATDALGHSYNEGICGVCGAEDPNYVPPHVCNVVEQDRVEATCTTDGYISYACDCGLGAYTETIPALGHTAGAAADCVNAQVCTVCGAELAAALGHSWNDATCTAPKTCSVCGATEGEALGHDYAESNRVDATCGADGSVTYTCGNCGDSYSDPIAATGEHVYFDDCSAICEACGYEREVSHNIVHVEAKAATCTAMGNIEYWYCDVCGMAWLDEACTLNTNMMAVKLPMADHIYFDDCSAICEVCGYEREAGHNVIHVEAKAATCTELGNIEYWYCDACGMAWLDAECTMNTNLRAVNLPMADHVYFDDCSAICEVCGYEREAGHNVIHVEAKAATCTELGNIEYWYCDACGMAWLDAECTMNTNLRAVNLPMADHVYFDDCSAICEVCGYEREVSHNIVHVEAKAATCTAMGNIEFWYCDVCGMAWLDEACTLNTNMMAVKLPATGEHTYDNDFDADCNVCGDTREVAAFPFNEAGKSISEDVGGLAFRFTTTAIEGLKIQAGKFYKADFTDATYNGYTLLGVGVTATNGKSTIDIPGLNMTFDENGNPCFAYRIVNISAVNYDKEITMTPYYVVEIDGVATTICGNAVVGSYNEVAIGD